MKSVFKCVSLAVLISVPAISAHAWGRRFHTWVVIDPIPTVVAAPVVVSQPTQVVQPVVVPDNVPPLAPPRNYSQILADFHNNAKRLQKLLDRQLAKGGITQDQYDRQAGALDQIILDEHKEAYDNGGNLTPRQIDSLDRRLNSLREQIQEDLAS
jgi:hypothetical protein